MIDKTFMKEDLLELLYEGDSNGLVKLEDNHVDSSRWSEQRKLIFKDQEGACWQVIYSQGLTEQQDESPFEYEPNDVSCERVYAKTVTSIIWTTEEPK